MRLLARGLLPAFALAAAAAVAVPAARAAAPAEIHSVVEGRDAPSQRSVLVLTGRRMTKLRSFVVSDPAGQVAVGPPVLRSRTKSQVVLSLEAGLPAGTYRLDAIDSRGNAATASFRVGGGVDAAALSVGTVPLDRFSAWEDLLDESKVGTADVQVARGDHHHDTRYLSLLGGTVQGGLAVQGVLTAVGTGDSSPMRGTVTSGTGAGVFGTSVDGPGVSGTSTFHYGLLGASTAATGTYGISTDGPGVTGDSLNGPGVYGRGKTAGVRAFASSGSAIRGEVNGGSVDHAVFATASIPVARISSAGKGFFNGGTQVGGADFAESVAVRGDAAACTPGTVMVVATDADRAFAPSSEAECPRVAGVVSTRPGVLAAPRPCAGDDAGVREGEAPLAVAGIVPVKVCDEGGPVRRGDLLVTASIPGHARRAPRRPEAGTVLGKALGNLDSGRGVVEVLLTLR